jgi:hypothetical protein
MFRFCVASAQAGTAITACLYGSSVLGDAIKITQHARFGVLEWSPKRSPKLGGSLL